ncbi:SDR family NAD(P)-dependent oxidoreductase [Chelatococcus asaccharovorans]|uniref:NAD(P)-dependent dehydrogenase (Short-subunit alcohol dehydrogenase family) n=1 Tax=Chelatococcus asaccharovorans TaxID=28210 RepID=A0A2V3U4N0_9HYPH|nr:SDR family oxidoreductase [Chelatococcus asaccharovorans]MBS7703721.1 SDR family oxidoreductase [Chelatococcus asaccharovorans]PXW57879.1 NAD(P)-dependent dehydrogenase (short-subunit alcohol dehydrogenase family) [Chelatococcus asaccharovorans]
MREGWIVVTGGNRGIGAAIARDLEGRGARVASISRSGGASAGRDLTCDVLDEAALAAHFAELAAEAPIVGLVNNAGRHQSQPSTTLSLGDFQSLMELNAGSVLLASRLVHPHLLRAGGGLIVNIGSFFDKLGTGENVAYSAAKAAVGAMTRCLAVEWAHDGIRLLNVAPGYIETDLNRDFLASERTRAWLARRIPVGRVGQAEEVGRLVGAVFDADVAFFTGATLYVDGGQGMNH